MKKRFLLPAVVALIPVLPLSTATACANQQIGSIVIANKITRLYKDKSIKFNIDADNYTLGQGIVWTSSDPKLAPVDENGVVIGRDFGHVEITACSAVDATALDTVSFDIVDEKDYERQISISDFNSSNYCLNEIRNGAPFITDISNFDINDKIEITIISEDNRCSLCNDANTERTDKLTYTISDKNTSQILPHVTTTDPTDLIEKNEYPFSLKYDVTAADGSKYEFIVEDLILDICKGTVKDYFEIDAETIITGIKEGKEDDFNDCDFLVIPEGITSIAENAFYDTDTGLTKIPNIKYLMLDGTWVKPDSTPSIASIGKNAFYKSSISGALYIPESVTTIGDNAFRSTSISSIMFHSSMREAEPTLTTIGADAFADNGNLKTQIVIPKSVTTIGNEAFCHSPFSGVSFEDGNAKLTIGNRAFNYQDDTKNSGAAHGNLVIPKRLQKWGSYAFCNQGFGHIYGTEKNTNIKAWPQGIFKSAFSMQGHFFFNAGATFGGNYNVADACNSLQGLHLSNENFLMQWHFGRSRSLQVIDLTAITDASKVNFYSKCFLESGARSSASNITVLLPDNAGSALGTQEYWTNDKQLTKENTKASKDFAFATGVRVTIDENSIEHGSISSVGDTIFAIVKNTSWRTLKQKYLGYVIPQPIPDEGYEFDDWYYKSGQLVSDSDLFTESTSIVPKFKLIQK